MNEIFVFAGIILSTFVLEDPATLTVGSLIAKNEVSFLFGFSALSIGIFFGDLGLYILGFLFKKKIFSTKKTFFSPSTAQVSLARFFPGARTITFLAAGHAGYPWKKFLLITFPSSLIWTLLLLVFTEQIFSLSHLLPVWGNWLVGLLLMVILFKMRTLMKILGMAMLIGVVIVHHSFFIDRKDRKKISLSLSKYCRIALRILDIEIESSTTESAFSGKLIVSNHMSYVDVICLSSLYPGTYVTSVEIRETPILGLICELCGCLFTERRRSKRTVDITEKELTDIQSVLEAGLALTLFPEGTSTNGQRLLPFKTTLFEGAFRANATTLPLLLRYSEIDGEKFSPENADVVCWYGDMSFLPHFLRLCDAKKIKVSIEAQDLLKSHDFSDRKELGAKAHKSIALALSTYL